MKPHNKQEEKKPMNQPKEKEIRHEEKPSWQHPKKGGCDTCK